VLAGCCFPLTAKLQNDTLQELEASQCLSCITVTTWSHSLHFGTNFTTTNSNSVPTQSHVAPHTLLVWATDKFDFFQSQKHASKSTNHILW
jgi:hypothetical protein